MRWGFKSENLQGFINLCVGRQHSFIGGTRTVEYVCLKIFMMRSVLYFAVGTGERRIMDFCKPSCLAYVPLDGNGFATAQARAVMPRTID